MAVWRYCPSCYRLADQASVVKLCPVCSRRGLPNCRLQALPLDPDAAQAAIRIGGAKALEQMIVGLVAGEDAAQGYEADEWVADWRDDARLRMLPPRR
jgi:hypothetical protein